MKYLALVLCCIMLTSSPLFAIKTTNNLQKETKAYKIPIIEKDPLQDKDFLNQHLGILADKEDLVRRGEITFFSSLAYLWVYQLIIFDVIFASQFNDMSQSGKLSSTNFIYSLFSTILMALMITRKDTQFIQYNYYKDPRVVFFNRPTHYREQTYGWRFMMNFMSYDF